MDGEKVPKDFIDEDVEGDSIEIPAMIDLPPIGDKEEIEPIEYDSDPFADWPGA